MIPDPTPSACCWYWLLLSCDPLGPLSDVMQEAMGGDASALRFFEPGDIVTKWALPLWLTHGTEVELRTVAAWWRAARERREPRFLSLAEINAGWDGGD
jgi:hypothetical protein